MTFCGIRVTGWIFLTGVLGGCATAPPRDLHWFRTAAEAHAVYVQTYRAAWTYVAANAPQQSGDAWAVVLDADETILDNSDFQLDQWRAKAKYTEEAWERWVMQERARALPGAKNFIDQVRTQRGKVIVVTNREEDVCDATRRNLAKLEIVVDACSAPRTVCRTRIRASQPSKMARPG